MYNKVFSTEKSGTLSEKILFRRIFFSTAIVVILLFSIGFTSFAYFSSSVTSSVNTLVAASYRVIVSPLDEGAAAGADGSYVLAAGEHSFKLSREVSESSASTGYCKIIVTSGEEKKEFFTQQIGVVNNQGEVVDERTVKLVLTVQAKIEFISCWGSCSLPDGEKISAETGIIEPNFSGGTMAATADEPEIPQISESKPANVSSQAVSSETQSDVTGSSAPEQTVTSVEETVTSSEQAITSEEQAVSSNSGEEVLSSEQNNSSEVLDTTTLSETSSEMQGAEQ